MASTSLSAIPDKVYFKIGEVAKITGLKTYTLRYWESEFSLTPAKSRSGQRLYRRKDIEQVLRINWLLHDKRMTIAGARQLLRRTDPDFASALGADDAADANEAPRDVRAREVLLQVRTQLVELRRELKQL